MTPIADTVVLEADSIQGVVEPAGYRILVRIPNLEAQMREWGNLHMPEERRAAEEVAQLVGQVIKLGPDAYQDKQKFPNGPWCKEGDYVMMRAYAGTRFAVRRHEYRLINDDTVLGVVAGEASDEIKRPLA